MAKMVELGEGGAGPGHVTSATKTVELTDKAIQGYKAMAVRQEIKDGKWPLVLVIQTTGKKTFQCRCKVAGKIMRRALGDYPAMSLSSARTAAVVLKARLQSGEPVPVITAPVAPVEPVVVVATNALGLTVSNAFAMYMENEGDAKASAGEKWRAFKRDIEPAVGSMDLGEVDFDDLAEIVEDKFDTAPVMSNRLVSLMGRFFRWCITKGRKKTGLRHNPMSGVVKLHDESARKRFLSVHEVRWFFEALSEANGCAGVFAMLAYTVTRRSDIFDLTWNMVEPERLALQTTKNGLPHMVWLHPTAKALIPARPDGAKGGDLVFTDHSKAAYKKPLDRVRRRMEELAEKEGETVEYWRLHDLRRTAITHMGSFFDDDENPLITPHTRDRILAHVDNTTRGKVYDRNEYYREKKAALKLYGDWLDDIRKEKA